MGIYLINYSSARHKTIVYIGHRVEVRSFTEAPKHGSLRLQQKYRTAIRLKQIQAIVFIRGGDIGLLGSNHGPKSYAREILFLKICIICID
jgi:hypothetical protein